MFQDGRGFVPDEIVDGATTFVLGQNPGADEEREGRPFVGKSGALMEKVYFPIAGLVRGESVSIGNVLRCRLIVNGRRSNTMPAGATLKAAVAHCTAAYLRIPASTRLVVAQGAYAVKLMGGEDKKVSEWRGFLLP
jgi:DNA polymerase